MTHQVGVDRLVGVLLDRELEIGVIDRLLERACSAAGGPLVLVGPPGIGKSALLDLAEQRAERREMTVLRANGVRSEGELAFAGLHQLVRPLLSRATSLPVAQRTVLESVFGRPAGGTDRFTVALAILDLLADAAAECPLLLLADDAHWLDGPSVEVLNFVGRRLAAEPIALVLATRDDSLGSFVNADLSSLVIGRLSDVSSRQLLHRAHPALSAKAGERALLLAQGNPLAVLELPATLSDDSRGRSALRPDPVSATLERSFVSRLDRLHRSTRLVVLAAAVDGAVSAAELLDAASAVLGTEVAVASLQSAIDARLVEVVGSRVRFVHPLVASAVYQAATVADRQAVHDAMAQLPGVQEDRRIWHRAHAALGTDDDVAEQLSGLAERAAVKAGASVAVAALERAAELTSDPRTSAEHQLRAAEMAQEIGQPHQALALLNGVDVPLLGLAGEVRAMVVRELAEFPPLADPTRLAHIRDVTDRLLSAGMVEPAVGLLWNAATKCWRASATPAERLSVRAATARLGLPDDHPLAVAVTAATEPEALLQLPFDDVEPDRFDLAGLAWHACAGVFLHRYPAATAAALRAVELSRTTGQLALVAQLGLVAARAATWSGDLDVALASAVEAERSAGEIGLPEWARLAGIQAELVRAIRGDDMGAAATVEQAEADEDLRTDRYSLAEWQHGLGVVSLGRDDPHGALRHLARVVDPSDAAFHYGVRLAVVGDLAEAAVAAEGAPAARRRLAPLLAEIGEPTTGGLAIGVHFARALLADPGDAGNHFGALLAIDLSRWPLPHGRVLLAHGTWLRRCGLPVEARESLRSARDTFDALRATGWSARARAELTRTGEASAASQPPRWASLTPQEWQIAMMAAAGLTNRQIGQQLFLSHRTVGSHLYHVFPKLGITSRAELAGALASTGQQPTSSAKSGH